MANITVTTIVNYDDDAISNFNNGETITINGGAVRIDADVRWNQQAAVFGNISLSVTLGGTLTIDGTQIWEVPFSASTGNVPTQSVLGSNGVIGSTSSATGELTRVWASGSLEPATAGGSMPATGWIKLRSKTGNFQTGETITLPGGATITASGPGKRSWINVVGRGVTSGGGSSLSLPRRGTFQVTGDWYDLGTTDGTDNQTFQFPVADQCPAIWVETAAGSGVYEIWLNALDRWLDGSVATDDKRGTYFTCDAATGVITIAARGANNAGYKPPSGCNVRVPNVILSSANGTTAAWSTNFIPAQPGSRYLFSTTQAGELTLSKVTCNWYINVSNAFNVNLTDVGVGPTSISNTALSTNLTDVGVGVTDTSTATPLTVSACTGGGALTRVRWTRRLGVGGGTGLTLSTSNNFTLSECRGDVFGALNTLVVGGLPFSVSGVTNLALNDCITLGGTTGVAVSQSVNVKINNLRYSGRTSGETQLADSSRAIAFINSTSQSSAVGLTSFEDLPNVHPGAYLFEVSNGANNITLSNVGSASSPYDLGSANQTQYGALITNVFAIVMRRIYLTNLRTATLLLSNTSTDVLLQNIWGDADKVQLLTSNDTKVQGARFSPRPVGDSSIYGMHWADMWLSDTSGIIAIHANEPTPSSVNECVFTLDSANGSGFTSTGSVVMAQLTDEVIWTMPYYALGVTGFDTADPTFIGTNAGNFTFDFQYDVGTDWNGTWLALTGANLSAITVDPAKGIKFKVRAQVNTAANNNTLTYLRIPTTTTAQAQQIEYPLPGALITVTNLVHGSRVKVSRADTGAFLAQSSTVGTSLTLDVAYTGTVRIEARNASSTQAYRPWITNVTATQGQSTAVIALQEED